MGARTFAIRELMDRVGVPARTIRHWVSEGVLPGPIGRGRGARYEELHVTRARAVLHLRSRGLSLRAIRVQLNSLTEEQVEALVPPAPRPVTADGVPAPPPPPTYPAWTCEIVQLMDGLLLMVDPAKGAVLRRIADDIYRHYAVSR